MPIEKSAGAIIFRRENNKIRTMPSGAQQNLDSSLRSEIKYLLIKYGWGHWEFSRGLIEKGESLEETAKREIEEETGIKDIKFIPGFKEWFKFFFKLKGENIMKIATFLLAETKTKEVKLSHEHIDYAWLEYKEALEKLTFKNSKDILKKANDFLSRQNLSSG